MSYRFCFGASGAGKSTAIHKEVIRRSKTALDHFCSKETDSPDQFLVIVPEQFTLITQKDLTAASPDGVIMNVDVLSFARLAHRVFEEISADGRVILDDTGKSLILRRLASVRENELLFLGKAMRRQGMAGEVKSTVSELMQYDIAPEELDRIAEEAAKSGYGSLSARLKDISVLYKDFGIFKQDRFLTGEDQMTLLSEAIPNSSLIRHSVIYFDGFTGFTPLQIKVLRALMPAAKELVFTVLYSDDRGPSPWDPYTDPASGQRLFYLSREMCDDIRRIARDTGCAHGEDIILPESPLPRFSTAPELQYLEKNLFRAGISPYNGPVQDKIRISEAGTVSDEVEMLCRHIMTAVMKDGYAFHDFAVITSDPETYGPLLERYGKRAGLPFYQDRTESMARHPLSQTILGALDICTGGLSYPAVFHYLRSGFSTLENDETDLLDNYCLSHGVFSAGKWRMAFDDVCDPLRARFLGELAPVMNMGESALEKCEAIRKYLDEIDAADRLTVMAEEFASVSDRVRERAYLQVYDAVLKLLDQIGSILNDEKISVRDFRELLEAGLEEIKLGTLPQNADSIIVGDLIRTRLPEVKVLCLLGCNDGLIPAGSSQHGIFSEHDRAFIRLQGAELSPDPREQIFLQRLYLYMNLTRPSERLWLSYAVSSADGSPMRPSVLVRQLTDLFPKLQITGDGDSIRDRLTDIHDSVYVYADALRRYTDALADPDKNAGELMTLHGIIQSDRDTGRNAARILDAAFMHYVPEPLSDACSKALYRDHITGSVTRLETMAQCPLRQFLKYGLKLSERNVYEYESRDTGTILHETIDRFSRLLKEEDLSWTDICDTDRQRLIRKAFSETAAVYRDLILYGTKRTEKQADRYLRILDRSAETLQYQLKKGSFTPAGTEIVFGERSGKGTELVFDLGGSQSVRLTGRVDRFDICTEDGKTYIKILDYKSGDHDLDIRQIRDGLTLQLMIYMLAVLKTGAGQGENVPAALLYYRFMDPLLDGDKKNSDIHKALRPKGLVNSDKTVLRLLDAEYEESDSSDVMPVSVNKDGNVSARSSVFAPDEFEGLMKDVTDNIRTRSKAILNGDKKAFPVVYNDKRNACTYCPYRDVCGFDTRLPGYRKRKIGERPD
ncbi:MAG: exodeoxyribonuclease V subunit gamma [Lachnospiraceae bacterium]|nr:exodeoxyribonuclease V subunit gamma [Lachnospiraceae bacterium]